MVATVTEESVSALGDIAMTDNGQELQENMQGYNWRFTDCSPE